MKAPFLLPICFLAWLAANAALAKQAPAPPAESATAVDLRAITDSYNTGKYSQALERGIGLLHREPTNLEAHYLLGNIFIKLNRLDDAADEYDYCYDRGPQTPSGIYARKALDGMNEAVARAAGQPPPAKLPAMPGPPAPLPTVPGAAGPNGPGQQAAVNGGMRPATAKIDKQTSEIKASVLDKAATALLNRRSTLQGQIRHLGEDQKAEIDAVPKYIYLNNHRVANPDYKTSVQNIQDIYAAKVQVLQEDNDNEERKINAFYKGLADSYDHSKPNLQSQTDDGRVGHKLVDPEPSMYVQNFAPGQAKSATHGSGVELKTEVRELPPVKKSGP